MKLGGKGEVVGLDERPNQNSTLNWLKSSTCQLLSYVHLTSCEIENKYFCFKLILKMYKLKIFIDLD